MQVGVAEALGDLEGELIAITEIASCRGTQLICSSMLNPFRVAEHVVGVGIVLHAAHLHDLLTRSKAPALVGAPDELRPVHRSHHGGVGVHPIEALTKSVGEMVVDSPIYAKEQVVHPQTVVADTAHARMPEIVTVVGAHLGAHLQVLHAVVGCHTQGHKHQQSCNPKNPRMLHSQLLIPNSSFFI